MLRYVPHTPPSTPSSIFLITLCPPVLTVKYTAADATPHPFILQQHYHQFNVHQCTHASLCTFEEYGLHKLTFLMARLFGLSLLSVMVLKA